MARNTATDKILISPIEGMMKSFIFIGCGFIFACGSIESAFAADANTFENYTQDLSVGEVSAGSILGISSSTVQTIHSAKDFGLVANALTQGANAKGVAFLVSPVRLAQGSGILPITREQYVGNPVLYGFLENLNFSYAQNQKTIGSDTLDQHAYSISTSSYLTAEQDPIYQYWKADKGCQASDKGVVDAKSSLNDALYQQSKAEGTEDKKKSADKVTAATTALVAAEEACLNSALPSTKPWNPNNLSFSVGRGTIGSTSVGHFSLGTVTAATVQLGIGKLLALSIAAQHVQNASTLTTIESLASKSSSTIGAIQIATNAGDEKARTRYLLEVSSIKNNSALASQNTFKYAGGLDFQLPKSIGSPWIQFRFGKSYSNQSGVLANSSLLTLTFGASSTLFSSQGS